MYKKIYSFWNKETEDILNGYANPKYNYELNKKANHKLVRLNNSPSIKAVGSIRGNRLEKKTGKIKGLSGYPNKFYTIWVDAQFRIIFTYKKGCFYDVVFWDYH